MALSEETEVIVRKAAPITAWLLRLCLLYVALAVALAFVVDYSFANSIPLVEMSAPLVPLMIALLVLEAALVVFSVLLARTGTSSYSRFLAATGVVILVGGIWADVIGTVLVTPDLASECNPFIVYFRQLQVPIWGMYLLGFVAQLGITIISCGLWLAFLRHHTPYLKVSWAMGSRGWIQFNWVALGGNLRGLPSYSRSYRALWVIALCLIEPFTRWLLGLKWIGVPILDWLQGRLGPWASFQGMIIQAIIVMVFLVWLSYSYHVLRRHAVISADRSPL